MDSNTPLSCVCRQYIPPLKAIICALLLTISLYAVTSCSQPGQGNVPTSTSTPATSPTQAVSSTTSTLAGQGDSLKSIHMIDADTGWALTSSSVFYTTNSWRTWKDVTPHKDALVGVGYFLSGTDAWISEATGLSLQAGQKPAVIVSHTTNAGQTWQSAALAVNVPEGVLSMSIINDRYGWAEADLGGAFGNDLEELFRTADGGKSWVAVSDNAFTSQDHIPNTFPYGGHATGITFINASTGWAMNTDKLYITHDGGTTWQPQTLPTGAGQGYGLPTFLTASDGLLTTGSRLFITHDSGSTWKPGPLLPQSSTLVAFIDTQHGWAAVGNGTTLYSTSDGGVHWEKITPAIAASIISVVQLNFVSAETGWALGYTSESQNTLLFKTTDGGYTWTRVPLEIP